jgi:modification methylase
MKTTHSVYFGNSRIMSNIQPETIDLIVTSPPYPMIEMWDNFFTEQSQEIEKAIKSNKVVLAFELMHKELDPIWNECYRLLKEGGLACINIGDATRTINNDFALYPNHARIISHMLKIGFSALPTIIWRKQTNAPNKFMGSGMLPPGAYVTLEHEYILILRKGSKMSFKTEVDKIKRRESAFFWEERNSWFSDVWMDLKGTSQKLNDSRIRFRSAAFPFELPYRLINMFSVKGGIVLDPFLGTGTTMLAAMSSARNSVGFEIDPNFGDVIINQANKILPFANEVIENRLEKHLKFIQIRLDNDYKFKYNNKYYGFPVMTKQEIDLCFNHLTSLEAIAKNNIDVFYSDKPQDNFSRTWNIEVDSDINSKLRGYSKKSKQKSFF